MKPPLLLRYALLVALLATGCRTVAMFTPLPAEQPPTVKPLSLRQPPLPKALVAPLSTTTNITLAWDPSFGAAGYRLHTRTLPSTTYANMVDVGNKLTGTLSVSPTDTNYAIVTAYSIIGLESEHAAELQLTPVPTPQWVISLQPFIQTNSTFNPSTWSNAIVLPQQFITNGLPAQFYRVDLLINTVTNL